MGWGIGTSFEYLYKLLSLPTSLSSSCSSVVHLSIWDSDINLVWFKVTLIDRLSMSNLLANLPGGGKRLNIWVYIVMLILLFIKSYYFSFFLYTYLVVASFCLALILIYFLCFLPFGEVAFSWKEMTGYSGVLSLGEVICRVERGGKWMPRSSLFHSWPLRLGLWRKYGCCLLNIPGSCFSSTISISSIVLRLTCGVALS